MHATLEVRRVLSDAPHSRSAIPLPNTQYSEDHKSTTRSTIRWPDETTTNIPTQKWNYDDMGVSRPIVQKKVSEKNCHFYRGTLPGRTRRQTSFAGNPCGLGLRLVGNCSDAIVQPPCLPGGGSEACTLLRGGEIV